MFPLELSPTGIDYSLTITGENTRNDLSLKRNYAINHQELTGAPFRT